MAATRTYDVVVWNADVHDEVRCTPTGTRGLPDRVDDAYRWIDGQAGRDARGEHQYLLVVVVRPHREPVLARPQPPAIPATLRPGGSRRRASTPEPS